MRRTTTRIHYGTDLELDHELLIRSIHLAESVKEDTENGVDGSWRIPDPSWEAFAAFATPPKDERPEFGLRGNWDEQDWNERDRQYRTEFAHFAHKQVGGDLEQLAEPGTMRWITDGFAEHQKTGWRMP
jgi:hypothetical protein